MKDFMGWQPDQPLVLASGSKTRQMMLAALDLPVEIIRPDLDEAAISHQMVKAGRSISGIAEALALQKALAISKIATDRYVLAADQTLECQGRLFMKAPTVTALRANLEQLSGRAHSLWSAATLVRNGEILWSGLERAEMAMLPLSPKFLEGYLQKRGDSMLHSVGGYEIEGFGPMLFSAIDGHHATILGMPLISMLAGMRDLGLIRS